VVNEKIDGSTQMADKQMAHILQETVCCIAASWSPMNRCTLPRDVKMVEVCFRN
jgi:hypothetical protein